MSFADVSPDDAVAGLEAPGGAVDGADQDESDEVDGGDEQESQQRSSTSTDRERGQLYHALRSTEPHKPVEEVEGIGDIRDNWRSYTTRAAEKMLPGDMDASEAWVDVVRGVAGWLLYGAGGDDGGEGAEDEQEQSEPTHPNHETV